MKRTLLVLTAMLVVLAGALTYRAATHFRDRQVPPANMDTAIEVDTEGAVRRLAGALTFRTVSYDDRSRFDAQAFESFHAYLAESFPLAHERLRRQVIAGHSLLYELPGRNPDLKPVLFMGHQDVVPVDEMTLDEWTHPPFAGTVADGRVWGRGALDDKFSVLGLLEAMEMLLARGLHAQRTIYLAFGHDEEVLGVGAAAVAQHLQERGVEFEFVLDEGGAVTEGLVEGIAQPVAVIGVSEKGYVNLRLVVRDPGGHSSQPANHTALGILARAIVRVEENPFPASLDPLLVSMDALGAHMPFAFRLAFANTWLFSWPIEAYLLSNPNTAAGIRTTTAATMASGSSKSNILPTRAEAVVNFRTMPGESSASVREHIVRAIDDVRVEVHVEMANEPSAVSAIDSPGYRLIAGTIRAFDENIIVAPYMLRGGSDARHFNALSPNVYRFYMGRATPKTLELAHGVDEHVSIEEYIGGVRFFYLMLAQAARADWSPR